MIHTTKQISNANNNIKNTQKWKVEVYHGKGSTDGIVLPKPPPAETKTLSTEELDSFSRRFEKLSFSISAVKPASADKLEGRWLYLVIGGKPYIWHVKEAVV